MRRRQMEFVLFHYFFVFIPPVIRLLSKGVTPENLKNQHLLANNLSASVLNSSWKISSVHSNSSNFHDHK